MSRLPLYFSLAAVLLAGARGEEPAAEKPKGYELKNRSSFTLNIKEARTPFWPIGWKRSDPKPSPGPASLPKAPPPKFQLKEQGAYFVVSSLLLGNPPLATINSRSYEEGEPLPVQVGGQPIRVVVKSIREGGVILEHDGEQLFVPIKRESFVPKPAGPIPQKGTPTIEIPAPVAK